MSGTDQRPAENESAPAERQPEPNANRTAAQRAAPRPEQAVFEDLSRLCTSPGYVHALAYLAYRDNVVGYSEKLTAEDVRQLYSPTRLIKTELATLHGLMIRSPVDYALPASDVIERYIEQSDSLLKELHDALSHEAYGSFASDAADPPRGAVVREAVFYGGESAYTFQYRDLAVLKYAEDGDWLRQNRGFTVGEAQVVVKAVTEVQERNLTAHLHALRDAPPAEWSLLPGLTFTAREVSEQAGLDEGLTERVLLAFSLPDQERNAAFQELDDYNAVTAFPLMRMDAVSFVLLQVYPLVEALYDTPFYWMGADRKYVDAAMEHRGNFTERFAADRLARVFGQARVFKNVHLFRSKGEELGEIDVLVVFGDRAIVLQAKSKRLTLGARKGNDQQISDDFKKSVEDSYAQAVACSEALLDASTKLVNQHGEELKLPSGLSEVYPVCLVADHYPALAFQVRAFLKTTTTDKITSPLVLDVFALDAMTEMLSSPLRLLAYIRQRVLYANRVAATHELTILSYHLKHNLWLSNEYDFVQLQDDFSDELDVAMAVRREGIDGSHTPSGILTRLAGTTIGGWVVDIEQSSDPGMIRLGMLLLTLSEDCVRDVSDSLDQMAARVLQDGQHHDRSIALGDTGLTVHCNLRPDEEAMRRLHSHCALRKYSMEVGSWHGVSINPATKRLRMGTTLEYPWAFDAALEAHRLTQTGPQQLPENKPPKVAAAICSRKVGRNDSCPCGSGKKYKKCCLFRN